MHFQPPGLFKVRKQESIQFGVSSKESKIAAMECSYLCTCVFASSTKLQPWSAHTCAPVLVLSTKLQPWKARTCVRVLELSTE